MTGAPIRTALATALALTACTTSAPPHQEPELGFDAPDAWAASARS